MNDAFPNSVQFDNFENKKARVTIKCEEGLILPGVKPLPIRLPDGEYDTSICKRYDEIMKALVQIERDSGVNYL